MKRFVLVILCVGLVVPTFSQDSDMEKYQVEIKEISSPDRDSILCSNDDPISDTVFHVGRGGIYYRNHSGLSYIIAL